MKSLFKLIVYVFIVLGLVYYFKPEFILKFSENPKLQDILLVLSALVCFWILRIIVP